MSDPIEKLRKLAEAATPVEWANFMAHFSPSRIQQLLDLVEAQDAVIAWHASGQMHDRENVCGRLDAKRAALAKALEVTDG